MHNLIAAIDAHPDKPSPLELLMAETAQMVQEDIAREAAGLPAPAESAPVVPKLIELAAGASPEPAVSPLDGLPSGTVLVPLGDTVVAVLPDGKWPNSANEDMLHGFYGRWARKALARDEDVEAWFAQDVDNDAVAQFFVDWARLSGRDPKEQMKRQSRAG